MPMEIDPEEKELFKFVENIKGKLGLMQTMYNYHVNLDSRDYSKPLKELNEELFKQYKIAETILENKKTLSKDEFGIDDELYAGTIILQDQDEKSTWVSMDYPETGRAKDALESHVNHVENDPEYGGDVMEKLDLVVEDYKLLTYGMTEFDFYEDVEPPSIDNDDSEIL